MNFGNYSGFWGNPYGFSWLAPVIALAAIWSIAWKGWALWRAARNNHRAWYIVLLVINTLGILEIIYIFGFSKRQSLPPQAPQI